MRFPIARVLAVSALLFTSDASAKVSVEYHEQADFAAYKTYALREGTPARDPLLRRRIERAIEAQLEGRGLPNTAATPDLYVIIYTSTKQKQEVHTINLGYCNPLDHTDYVVTIDIGTLRLETWWMPNRNNLFGAV